MRFGIRPHVIARDTADAAWAQAQAILDALDPAAIEAVQAGLALSESEGQRRMRALGIDEFILSGHPHLEEAWWVGEGVLPVLRARGLWEPPAGSLAQAGAEPRPYRSPGAR